MSKPEDNSSQDPTILNSELQPIQDINRIIHEPARLLILSVLNAVEEADFKFLSIATSLTKGNLSRQTTQLEEAGYIQIHKYYKGKIPATNYRLTASGKAAFVLYWNQLATLGQQFQFRSEHSQTEAEGSTNH
jgi:DNA-binding HxlR family transcriptional regulator